MNIGEKITHWLQSDGSYRDGLALLEALGKPCVNEKAWLSRPFISSAAKQALRERLYAFKSETLSAVSTAPKITVAEPSIIAEYREKGKRLLKEQSEVKGRLNQMCEDTEKYSDSDRYEVAAYIMQELIPAIDGVYDTIREYEQSGTLPKPPEQADIIKQTVKKMQRLQSITPRISRLNKYLKDDALDLATKAKYEKELADKLTEQASLKQELGI